jgi:hypothetical protein
MSNSYFSGDPTHLVVIVVFAAIGAWNLWTASQYGYVSGRRVRSTRADQRVTVWILVTASAVCCVAGLYFLARAFARSAALAPLTAKPGVRPVRLTIEPFEI